MNDELMISFADGRYLVIDTLGAVAARLVAGDRMLLSLSGLWQEVQVHHGGYQGWYYVTASGKRERFALAMRVRLAALEVC